MKNAFTCLALAFSFTCCDILYLNTTTSYVDNAICDLTYWSFEGSHSFGEIDNYFNGPNEGIATCMYGPYDNRYNKEAYFYVHTQVLNFEINVLLRAWFLGSVDTDEVFYSSL